MKRRIATHLTKNDVVIMADKTWKAVEREIARRLGGQRMGCTGQATADVITPSLAIEVKTRRRLPSWLLDAIEQAVAAASEGALPELILFKTVQISGVSLPTPAWGGLYAKTRENPGG